MRDAEDHVDDAECDGPRRAAFTDESCDARQLADDSSVRSYRSLLVTRETKRAGEGGRAAAS